MTRTYIALNWEAGDTAYLSIARPDQPVERIELTTADVARLLADGAYLWSMVEPRRQGTHKTAGDAEKWDIDNPPHFIGFNGE
ncbi:hypothetical protein [Xanthobacter sediminis]